MTKDVLVSISGIHMLDGEGSDVELVTTGNYYEKNGIRYLLYDELMEGLSQPVKNVVKVREDSLEIIRRGEIHAHMTFKKGMTIMASYRTPFGEMLVGITTERIAVEEEEDSLAVQVDYALDINGQEISRCSIVLEARSRGNFSSEG